MFDILSDFRDLIFRLLESPALKMFGAIVAGVIQQLFGDEILPAHSAILILVAADWCFGLTYAVCRREVSSAKSLRGVLKLMLYAGVFLVSAQLAKVGIVGPLLGGGLAGVVVVTEAISVLEKIDRIARWKGVDLPIIRPLVGVLKQQRDHFIR